MQRTARAAGFQLPGPAVTTTPLVPAASQLAAALARFQKAMPLVAKTKTAQVRSEKGSYSYTYAGLAEVSAVAAPLLADHGLAFSCVPTVDEHGHILLSGVLMHESGEQLAGSLPISGGTPQQVGSALTYARRYLLGCMTGIVTDDDDDGAAASRKPAKKAADPAPAGPTQTVRRQPRGVAGAPVTDVALPAAAPDAAPAPDTSPTGPWQPDPWASQSAGGDPHAHPQQAPPEASPVSDSLRRSLMAASSRVGIDPTQDRDMRLALWSALLARKVTTANDLARSEALTLLRRLNDVETGAVEWDYSVETGAVRLRHIDREPPA